MSALADHHRGGKTSPPAPPLLLIHGFTATWRAWGPVRELLEEQFDVLAPTVAGHTGGPEIGDGVPVPQMVDNLIEMLDEVGWERPHVAGFSMGGQLALELAKRGRARDVTAIAPGGAHGPSMERELNRVGRAFRRNHGAARRLAKVAERLGRNPTARRVFLRDMMVDGSKIPHTDSSAMMAAFADTPVFEAYLDAAAAGGRELRDLDRIDVPVTIAWGDKDRTLPQAKHEAFFREHLPQARFVTVKQAGHVPFWDAPERIADIIAQTALTTERKAAA